MISVRVILVLLRLVRSIRVEVSLSLLGSLVVLLLAGVLLLVRLMMPSTRGESESEREI